MPAAFANVQAVSAFFSQIVIFVLNVPFFVSTSCILPDFFIKKVTLYPEWRVGGRKRAGRTFLWEKIVATNSVAALPPSPTTARLFTNQRILFSRNPAHARGEIIVVATGEGQLLLIGYVSCVNGKHNS
jgi:hypothetical protein